MMIPASIAILALVVNFVIDEFAKLAPVTSPAGTRLEPDPDGFVAPILLAPAPTLPLLSIPVADEPPPRTESVFFEPSVMYVGADSATCLAVPHEDFDNQLSYFPYGSAVTVSGYSGRYARIVRQTITGWVLKDELVKDKQQVWPLMKEGVVYDSEHEDTKKIRLILRDEFSGGRLNLPLQPSEYIHYRLAEDNRVIPWPARRPRLPGNWQVILRGQPGIHIGISPKTDSIMEWQNEGKEGTLAYVEKVAPDGTITVAALGMTESARFGRYEFPEIVWREWRPVFIEVL